MVAHKQYPFKAPSSFLKRIHWNDSMDPLLRQIMPVKEELHKIPGFISDPLNEVNSRHLSGYVPGLIQKYQGRVLLRVSPLCAIHCRFCFRRHDDYMDVPKTMNDWQPALDFIKKDPSLHEVIYSGGDPLMLDDRFLKQLTRSLSKIPHLKRLRIHSRMPVVAPNRISKKLIQWMTETRLKPIMVIHCNHANELNESVFMALSCLIKARIPVLSQSVLLKNINDNENILADLFEALINGGIMPYYLHLLDPVDGAAHFQVEEKRATDLMTRLRNRLPGYAVPRLVREEPKKPAKTVINH